jgi:hypothetical protein
MIKLTVIKSVHANVMRLFAMINLKQTLIQCYNLASVTTTAYTKTTKKRIWVDWSNTTAKLGLVNS